MNYKLQRQLELGKNLWPLLREQLWGGMEDKLKDELWNKLGSKIRILLRGDLEDEV